MTLDDVRRLHKLQSEFEKNSANMQAAYEFFQVSFYNDDTSNS